MRLPIQPRQERDQLAFFPEVFAIGFVNGRHFLTNEKQQFHREVVPLLRAVPEQDGILCRRQIVTCVGCILEMDGMQIQPGIDCYIDSNLLDTAGIGAGEILPQELHVSTYGYLR